MSPLSVDSALFSEGFELSSEHHEAWKKEIEHVHSIRGNIMTTMFELEAMIDVAIADVILPDSRSARTRPWLRNRHFLLRNHILTKLNLDSKIEVLFSLMAARFPRQRTRIDRLKSSLHSARSIRNAMAHGPVYFKAHKSKTKGRWVTAHLVTKKAEIQISDGYVRNFLSLARNTQEQLHLIMRQGLRIAPRKID